MVTKNVDDYVLIVRGYGCTDVYQITNEVVAGWLNLLLVLYDPRKEYGEPAVSLINRIQNVSGEPLFARAIALERLVESYYEGYDVVELFKMTRVRDAL